MPQTRIVKIPREFPNRKIKHPGKILKCIIAHEIRASQLYVIIRKRAVYRLPLAPSKHLIHSEHRPHELELKSEIMYKEDLFLRIAIIQKLQEIEDSKYPL